MKITIYTDGASRGNPGPSASGYTISSGSRHIYEKEVYNGIKTNNFAEYTALILALEWCMDNYEPKILDIELYSDSELVVRQLKGHYKVKAEGLLRLNEKARGLMTKFNSVSLNNLPREAPGISKVDRNLNRLLDKMEKEDHSKE